MSKRSRQKRRSPKVDYSYAEQFGVPKKIPKRLHGKKRTKLRSDTYSKASGKCHFCGGYAPLYYNGIYDPFVCGDMCHIKGNGAGGPDEIENTVWGHHRCHNRSHNGEPGFKIKKEAACH